MHKDTILSETHACFPEKLIKSLCNSEKAEKPSESINKTFIFKNSGFIFKNKTFIFKTKSFIYRIGAGFHHIFQRIWLTTLPVLPDKSP